MKDKNRQFEETGAFLDLMSRREKKRWLKEQKKLKNTEDTNNYNKEIIPNDIEINDGENNEIQSENKNLVENEITEDNKNLDTTKDSKDEEQEDNQNDAISEIKEVETVVEKEETKNIETTAEQNKETEELEKTQKILEITTEINTINNQDNEDDDLDEDDASSGFNPVIPIGISLFFIYAFFIYISIATDFTNETFLTFNIIILSTLTFFFCLTTLSNKKHVNTFAVIDLVIILAYILFMGISLVSYDDLYKEGKVDKKPIKEEITQKPTIDKKPENIEKHIYSCENENKTLNIIYNTENQYITYMKKIEVFNDEEIANEISGYYQDISGITISNNEKEVTLEFNFNSLDINKYKVAITKHNDAYRLESDFSYIENNKINANKYKILELKNLTCTEIKS